MMDKSKDPLSNSVNNEQSVNTNTFSTNISGVIYATNLHFGSGYNAVSKNEVASESAIAKTSDDFSTKADPSFSNSSVSLVPRDNRMNLISSGLQHKTTIMRQRKESSRLLDYANQSRNQGLLNDVTIKVGTEFVLANRMVLSCYSPFFKQKLNLKESTQQEIEIKEVEMELLIIVIDFIYGKEISINNENVIKLLTIADKLELEEVKEFCFELLELIITPENSLFVLEAAIAFNNVSMTIKARRILAKNFDKISRSESFKIISKEAVHICISNLNRNKVDEQKVYQAILSWTKYDEAKRQKDFSYLFQALKLERFSYDYLLNVVSKEKLVCAIEPCLNSVFSTLPNVLHLEQLKKSEYSIISLGGDDTPSKVTEIYSLIDEPAKEYPALPIKLICHSSVKLGNFVYCIGGQCAGENQFATDKVWRLNLTENKMTWREVASMNKKREYLSATVYMKTLIVSCGGDQDILSKMNEMYDPSLQQWKFIAPLQQKRLSHALVACSNHLYAIGGWCNKKLLSSVERLSDLKSKWKHVKPIQTPRDCLAAVNCKGFLYVIGGRSDCESNSSLKSMEKYNPVANEWIYVSDMIKERSAHSACVLQDKIFVIGGLDSNGVGVKEIECYDPLSDKWSIVGSTKENLHYHSTVVV